MSRSASERKKELLTRAGTAGAATYAKAELRKGRVFESVYQKRAGAYEKAADAITKSHARSQRALDTMVKGHREALGRSIQRQRTAASDLMKASVQRGRANAAARQMRSTSQEALRRAMGGVEDNTTAALRQSRELGRKNLERMVQGRQGVMDRALDRLTGAQRQLDIARNNRVTGSGTTSQVSAARGQVTRAQKALEDPMKQLNSITRRASSYATKTENAVTQLRAGQVRGWQDAARRMENAGRSTVNQAAMAYNDAVADVAGARSRLASRVEAAAARRSATAAEIAGTREAQALAQTRRANIFQRGLMKASDAIDRGLGKATEAAGKVSTRLGLQEAGAGLSGYKAGVLRRASQQFGDSTAARLTGKALSGAANLGGKALGATGKVLASPTKLLTGTFNTVEKLGKVVAPSKGFVGGTIRGLTSASGAAAGFAISSVADAVGNAAEFYRNGGELNVLWRKNPTESVKGSDGKIHQVERKEIDWKEFGKEYARNVGKGLLKGVSLGFAGSGDNTIVDKMLDSEPSATGSGFDPHSPKEGIVDKNGKAVFSAADIDRETAMLKSAHARSLNMQELARKASTSNLSEENFNSVLNSYMAMRDERKAKGQQAYQDGRLVSRHGGSTAEDILAGINASADKEYNNRVGILFRNNEAMATKIANRNRDQAYLLATGGRVYADDAAGLTSGALKGDDLAALKEFNVGWNSQSLQDRATWDGKAAKEAYDKQVQAAYDAAAKEEEAA